MRDVGNIIRCNDCKNYMAEWSPYDEEHYCKVMRRNMKPTDWCNYADDKSVGHNQVIHSDEETYVWKI